MKKIRIAQIGVGHDHGTAIFRAFSSCPEFEMVGYSLPENEEMDYKGRLSAFDAYPKMTVEKMLSDESVDAVAIETEEKNLAKYALLAARAGKHIHMDKPGGLSVTEFEELISEVKARGVTLHLGYMYRYNPMIGRVLEEVREGKLGEIFAVEAEMNGAYPDPSRIPWLSRFGNGGMMFFLGCHMVDLVLQILGTPDRVTTHSTRTTDSLAVDYGMAVFDYPRARATVRTAAGEWGGNRRRHLVVSGTLGTVEIRPLELEVDDALVSAFAKMVRGERENPFTPDYELSLYKIFMEACDLI